MSDRKTKTEQDDIHTSMALTYDTGGSSCCDCVLCVAVKEEMRSVEQDFASEPILWSKPPFRI
jgi:hypothetical protein